MARQRSSGITSLALNQDQACFTCCLTSGLRVYNVDPLVEKTHYSKEEVGEVSLCEMISRTNWLLVVKARRPNHLYLLDDKKRRFVTEVEFKSPIRGLRSRSDKVAVVLQSSIQVLVLPMLTRAALLRTPNITRPLCAIATDPAATPLLIAPAHRKGSLQILDVSRSVKDAQSSAPAVINCHNNELMCISIAPNAVKLATASARGTLVRVWDAHTRQLLHELRRGSDYADVYCINFNQSGTLVCCLSDKGTLHVWAARGAGGRVASACAPPDTHALCALRADSGAIVICKDGTFHKFKFSGEGACHRSDYDYFLQVGDDDEFTQ